MNVFTAQDLLDLKRDLKKARAHDGIESGELRDTLIDDERLDHVLEMAGALLGVLRVGYIIGI
jgi:hypothetical protein